MSRALRAAVLAAASVSSAVWLGGCAAAAPGHGAEPSRAASAPPAPPVISHDFSGLVLAPFGTAFKDVSVPLTEVLVFHPADEARAREDGDCFRPNVAVSFLGRTPTDHLLCFNHDRLQKIEAAVAMPAAEAPALFAAACADWQQKAAPTGTEPDACEGREQDIAFSARRTQGPDPDAATVSITLAPVSSP
ncbi:MAG: hypothetical protein ABSG30_10250 [Steroidobacteraceae bacterium]